MKKKKQQPSSVDTSTDGDTWIDKIVQSQVSFGCRNGHVDCMRLWAVRMFGAGEVAPMSDSAIEHKILKEGYLPIRISGEDDFEDDGVFLIKKEVLKTLPCFSR